MSVSVAPQSRQHRTTIRYLSTAGERLAIRCEPGWVDDLLIEAAAGEITAGEIDAGGGPASITVHVESDRRPFHDGTWAPLTRGAVHRDGEVVLRDVCTSGFDMRVRCQPDGARLWYRWRPPPRTRAASMALRSRFHLLVRAALVQFPALWWAGTRGRVPLHAPAVSIDGMVALLAGPGGVGKTSLLLDELGRGGRAVSDNLSVSDGMSVWGLVEPLRSERGSGRRMPHGRREGPLPDRAPVLVPDHLVVLRRVPSHLPGARPCAPEAAARVLSAGTYMAGELRRYWALAATLAEGTGVGPVHPAIDDVASRLAARLRCVEVTLGQWPRPGLAELVALGTPTHRLGIVAGGHS